MAKQRIVNDSFWGDPFIQNLSPTEKLLFLYFLTNPFCNIAGVYEITLKQICFDTDIPKDKVRQTVDKLSQAGKIFYENDWMVLINFLKNQRINPSIKEGIKKIIESLPAWLKDRLGTDWGQYGASYLILSYPILSNSISSAEAENYVFSADPFEKFWNAYDKKVGKEKAIENWKKLKIDPIAGEEIISAAGLYSANTKRKYRKDPERWIRDKRWKDELEKKLKLDNIKTVEEMDSYLENASDRENHNASVILPELYIQSKYCRI